MLSVIPPIIRQQQQSRGSPSAPLSPTPPTSPCLSPSRPRPAVSIMRDDSSPDDSHHHQTHSFLRRVCRCNSTDAAIYLNTIKEERPATTVKVPRFRSASNAGQFWPSPTVKYDDEAMNSQTESLMSPETDTERSVTAASSTMDVVRNSALLGSLPQNESQASLMAMVDQKHQQQVCCDGEVAERLDGEEEFLQEFVFGSSAFQVDFVNTMTQSLLDRTSSDEMVSFPDLPSELRSVTRFYALRAPSISIHAYLKRMERHFLCSRECYLLALIYLDRLSSSYWQFRITRRSIHKFFLTALVIAVKYFDDIYYDNKYYAHVGGVRVAELDIMELTFLQLLDWHLFVTADEFAQCAKKFLVTGSGSGEYDVTAGPVPMAICSEQ